MATLETRPDNRPGLPSVAYRIGTHTSFRERMLHRLARSIPSLTTRAADDPAVALADAWATTADVLTFYQERIANEGFLRTATERQSVLELARAIGYELSPGVAANVLLAFVVEDAPGAPGQVSVDAGTQVLSIPGQNERPQTFETVEAIIARADWNALRVRTTAPQSLEVGATEVLVRGGGLAAEPGDGLLLIADAAHWQFRLIRGVESLPPALTRVTWSLPLEAALDTFAVFVLRQRAALFGYNAPDFRLLPDTIRGTLGGGAQWPNFTIAGNRLDLDSVYPRIGADSWAVLTGPGGTRLFHVADATQTVRTDYGLSAKVTRLVLDGDTTGLAGFGLRDTLVFAQAEPLPLAEAPIVTPLSGATLNLAQAVDGLCRGQQVLVTGPDGAEAATIDAVAQDAGGTTVTLAAPLLNEYDRATLSVNANVARATHGEKVVDEVLGSGNASTPNQRFKLRRPPLTHVSAPTASGVESTLEVRVDGVAWQQVPSLFGLGARDQSFVVRIEDDGQTQIIFGDGVRGTRLSTGSENVVATYRSGLGPDGNVRAGALSLLPARPLGIRTVSNPLPASGAAPTENLDDARANAPLTVLTLDRIVSLRDFEDFSRAFAGVGKAQATQVWTGQAHIAHITVGGASGGLLDVTATLPNLLAAIDRVRDPDHTVLVQNYAPRAFGLTAEVLLDPRFRSVDIVAACTQALRDTFSFARRGFGQSVTAAEILTTLQSIPGVQAVALDNLSFVDAPTSDVPAFLPAASARWTGASMAPAELLLIDPAAITLAEMAPTA